MNLVYPAFAEWKKIYDKFENKLENYKKETEIRQFLTENSWILSMVFGSNEGVVFSEYRLRPRQQTDHLVVNGRSLYMRITLIELKKPDVNIFKKRGGTTSDFNTSYQQTIDRLEEIVADRQSFLKQLKENIVRVADEDAVSPFQGVIKDNFFDVIRFNDITKFHLNAKIIIGRRKKETLDERNHRVNLSQDPRIEVFSYDRLLDMIGNPPIVAQPEWSWT